MLKEFLPPGRRGSLSFPGVSPRLLCAPAVKSLFLVHYSKCKEM
jgi:hypothetical protein